MPNPKPCRWLDEKHGMMVELPALDRLPLAADGQLPMTLRVLTSNMKGAGTDANVVGGQRGAR
jgi:hypothetical protein